MTRRYVGYNGTRAEALDVLQMDTELLAPVAEKISCTTVPPLAPVRPDCVQAAQMESGLR